MESLSGILSMAQVVLGIGLVIFVHELGHYLAARWCGVRVITFSLGFGPKLIGKEIGGTLYQIAAVPLGGFCRMAGEESRGDGLPPAPDELPAKGVGQRFFIYSGGVLMNVLFALIVFPILFHVGVPFISPIISTPLPGSPAWHAGLEEGTEILSVDGAEVVEFTHIATEVALGPPGEIELEVRERGSDRVRTVRLEPRMSSEDGIRTIGVLPDLSRDEQGRVRIQVEEGSPAEAEGLSSEDGIVGLSDPRPGYSFLRDLTDRMARGETIGLDVAREDDLRQVRITPQVTERTAGKRVGIATPFQRVLGVRANPKLAPLGLRNEDRILRAQGQSVLRYADLARIFRDHPGPLRLQVMRGDQVLELDGPSFSRSEAVSLADDIALGQDLDSTVIVVSPGEPASEAGMRDGDRILKIDGSETEGWRDVAQLVREAGNRERPAVFTIERDTGEGLELLELSIEPWAPPLWEYGLAVLRTEYIFKADGLGDAIWTGGVCSWRFLKDSWLTLTGIIGGQVSSDNIGGIITIGVISYSLAQTGFMKLLFFLCMLSINLAFINVLPIPVLDGGHLFFLIIEKIKGSPVSERVLGYSQMVGVVLILSLIVFVTYNDLVRVLG